MGRGANIDWGGIATGGITGALGAGMGLLLEGHNDRRQLRQNRKLQEQQMAGQKEMTDYNMSKQMEMWENTSYSAQKEQMEKAGINPALLYGMSGGGGQSIGQSGSSVGTGAAPSGGGEAMGGFGMGMQMAQLSLLKAQKENIEADTRNKEVGATATEGVVTDKARQEIAASKKGMEEKDVDIATKDLNLKQRRETYEEEVDQIVSAAAISKEQVNQQEVKTEVERASKQGQIDNINREAANKLLTAAVLKVQPEAIKAGTANTQAETKLKGQAWEQNITKLVMEWQKLSYTQRMTRVAELVSQDKTGGDHGDIVGPIVHAITTLLK